MEEERREAAAAALLVIVGSGGGEHDDVARRSCCCNLCGDVGFRDALLPCGARGCSRLQHTYCGSRYCPEVVVDDAKRWRCEWCAWEDGDHRAEEKEEQEEQEDSSGKRRRRAPPSYSSSPPAEVKQASSSPERSTDKERRNSCHREERREPTLPVGRAHAPPATSPSVGADVSVETDQVMHRDKQRINTHGGGGGGGGGRSRALDRWKNLAKRTRLGGRKYKLLADVLC